MYDLTVLIAYLVVLTLYTLNNAFIDIMPEGWLLLLSIIVVSPILWFLKSINERNKLKVE